MPASMKTNKNQKKYQKKKIKIKKKNQENQIKITLSLECTQNSIINLLKESDEILCHPYNIYFYVK